MLKVVKENAELGPPYEDCCMCGTPTPFWYPQKDVPLCKGCANDHDATDIPSKQEWVNS